METKNKYYTPETEEFCFDFEFELLSAYDELDEMEDGNWLKFRIGLTDKYMQDLEKVCLASHKGLFGYILEAIESGNIRVKSLDKKDIESLGFTEKPINHLVHKIPNTKIFEKGMIKIVMYTDKILIHTMESLHMLFEGKIKNKSELRKILEMTGCL
jgi:hypothetical protein